MLTARMSLLSFICIILIACQSISNFDRKPSKSVSIGTVTVEIPHAYKFIRGKGIDSYVAYIINERDDTFQIEYGEKRIINDLFDYPPVAFPLGVKGEVEKSATVKPTSSEVVYTRYPDEDNKEGVFLKNYYRYDTLGPLIIKVVQPKRIGNGKTGMYVCDLPDGNCLSIYAVNLDSAEHIEAMHIFHSIKLNSVSK